MTSGVELVGQARIHHVPTHSLLRIHSALFISYLELGIPPRGARIDAVPMPMLVESIHTAPSRSGPSRAVSAVL